MNKTTPYIRRRAVTCGRKASYPAIIVTCVYPANKRSAARFKMINCPNCGALMQLAPSTDYYTCAYCTTFYFPEPNDDHVRVLAEPVGMACPRCHGELVAGVVAETRVAYCGRCRGILASRTVFGVVVGYLRSRARTPALPPRPVDLAQLKRQIRCPQCGRTMDVHPYYGPGNIVIDTCGACQLLWLDHGELASIVDAPGRDRRT